MKTLNDYVTVMRARTFLQYAPERPRLEVSFFDSKTVKPLCNAPYKEHVHRQFEMIVPRRNPYRCLLNRRETVVEKGSFLILTPGQLHQDLYEKSSPFFSFQFQLYRMPGATLCSGLFAGDAPTSAQTAAFRDSGMAFQLIGLLFRESVSSHEFQTFQTQNRLFRVLFDLSLESYAPEVLDPLLKAPLDEQAQLARLMKIFEKHLRSGHSLEQFCRESGMSKSSLTTLCRRVFSLPPLKAFMKFKIGNAAEMLRMNPEMSVKELSDDYGFSNPFHFSRLFKQYTGRTPSAYRRRPEDFSTT